MNIDLEGIRIPDSKLAREITQQIDDRASRMVRDMRFLIQYKSPPRMCCSDLVAPALFLRQTWSFE